ncbi:MAG: phytoene desaturase [Deltaproteobacteria bacterium]|nr:phytoene desaturase [Deltaproteobacteria bacterium]TLN01044.1 MAG: phytoene desaturase [bacterium]
MSKKIAIIGAGPGGLTAGMILARHGYDVEIFEKEGHVGGRNAPLKLDGYTFDTGPTFLMMNFVLEEVFRLAGKDVTEYLEQVKLDPMYRLVFSDLEMTPSSDPRKMEQELARVFPGSEAGYRKFLEKEKVRFDAMYPCLKVDYSSFSSLFSANLLRALPHLSLGKSIFENLGEYFTPEKLKLSFTFQSKYLGMSAWECPAAFSIIPFIEHSYGIFHVIGGLNMISQAMEKVFCEHGGTLRLNTPVERILVENKTAKGVVLAGGEEVFADEVIVNADFAYAMAHLTDPAPAKYSREKLDAMEYSCSTFMVYLGIDHRYDIPHHNVFFAENYRENIEDIFNNGRLSDDLSFYVQNASVTDPTLAPEGHSTIYVLVPVPNLSFPISWEREKERYTEKVLDALESRAGLAGLRSHIKVSKITTPDDWRDSYHVYKGATFNLAHTLRQMLYFRPHNEFESFRNCYLVGGGTHPGSGLPTIYESGRISAEMILSKHAGGKR